MPRYLAYLPSPKRAPDRDTRARSEPRRRRLPHELDRANVADGCPPYLPAVRTTCLLGDALIALSPYFPDETLRAAVSSGRSDLQVCARSWSLLGSPARRSDRPNGGPGTLVHNIAVLPITVDRSCRPSSPRSARIRDPPPEGSPKSLILSPLPRLFIACGISEILNDYVYSVHRTMARVDAPDAAL